MGGYLKKCLVILMTGTLLAGMASCGNKENDIVNLVEDVEEDRKVVNLFGPMEKSNPDAGNIARSAHDLTIMMAEEK